MIIPGFTDYDLSEDGIITKISTGKTIRPRKTHIGIYTYMYARLVDSNGISRCQNIMRLLAITYLPKQDKHCMARAKDGDNTNTVLSNVEWVPYCECTKAAWDNGKMSGRPARKGSVTEDTIDLVYETMKLYDTPVTMVELSNALELPYATVRYAVIALRHRGKVKKPKEGFEAIQ